ncbi:MAG: hypothetical protein H6657_30580 [Ardenticatenaceae bacterium]|nr:hypothetical protein [Anaerolineales bacterium]MCB8981775.1 hypothetical protein [Ardenticatenaceae bacterium]
MFASVFQSVVAKVFESELAARGYEMDLDPSGYDWKGNIWFEKRLNEGIFVLVHIQPSGIENNFVSFAVNLDRNTFGLEMYRERQIFRGYFLNERLASALWISDRHDPEWKTDYWWSFPNEESLEAACQDALEKLLKYGIPYLEDLNTKSLRIQG